MLVPQSLTILIFTESRFRHRKKGLFSGWCVPKFERPREEGEEGPGQEGVVLKRGEVALFQLLMK